MGGGVHLITHVFKYPCFQIQKFVGVRYLFSFVGVRYLFLYRYKRARGNVCHVKSSILFHECQVVSDLALQFRFGHVFSRAIPRKKRGPNKGAALDIELSMLKV